MKLAELHSDLKIQEKDELSWKKLKAEGLDEDGEKEAKLRRNLNGKVYLCRRSLNLHQTRACLDTCVCVQTFKYRLSFQTLSTHEFFGGE